MAKKGLYTYHIAAREIDFTRRPTIAAISDLVLDAAGANADDNGFGIRDLVESNWTWVLTRFCIELDRYPDQYDELRVETWVSDVNRLMTTRNFVIRDGQDARIGAAVSNWAMLDLTSRRAVDLTSHLAYSEYVIPEVSPVAAPCRLGAVTAADDTFTHRVAYSDLDFNRHTNTIRYIEMMSDLIPLEFHETHTVRRMDMNFVHESRYGERLTVAAALPGDFEITKEDGTCVCRARMEF